MNFLPKSESRMKLSLKERKLVREYTKKLIGKRLNEASNYNELEFIGPSVDEILDAINSLNGIQLSASRGAFKFRDQIKLTPEDKTGHTISKNKFSVLVFLKSKGNQSVDESEYILEANAFLRKNGFECKLYLYKNN